LEVVSGTDVYKKKEGGKEMEDGWEESMMYERRQYD